MVNLEDNVFNARRRRGQARLKLWRYAGLLLTYRCNAACRFCYYYCHPQAGGLMATETALAAWAALRRLAGDNARVHLTGGEPFLVFDRLLEICEQAQRQGLGGADYVETNAGWVTDEAEARRRIAALDAAGLNRLKISWDLFHAEFVPVEKVLFLVLAAREILGEARVLVRWEHHLDEPMDTAHLSVEAQRAAMAEAMSDDGGRFTGRAAELLAPLKATRTIEELSAQTCQKALLGAKGVHIDPYGNVFSGQCSGMAVGNVNTTPLDTLWKGFDPQRAAFWKDLYAAGPCGLLDEARQVGYENLRFYASKCHLCSEIRRFYFDKGHYLPIICPDDCYGK